MDHLPSLLVDTYKRYKSGTQIVATWLATSAAKIQSIDHLLIKNARLKGQARAAARQNGVSEVPLNAFRTLVDILAKAKITLPTDIEAILWSVITARKECAGFYRAKPEREAGDDIDDEGHQFFIDILDYYYHTLKAPTAGKTKEEREKGASTNSRTSNFFEHLSLVQEHAEPSGYVPSVSTDTQSRSYRIKESANRKSEKAFALFCFLKDMTAIRLFVHKTWRGYKERSLALTTAATTANVAVDILRRVNEAFLKDFPEFESHHKVIKFLESFEEQGTSGITRKDEMGWYDLDDFKLSPQTFVCKDTYNVYFRDHLFDHDGKKEVMVDYHSGRKTARTEQTHMRRCLSVFLSLSRSADVGAFTRDHDILARAIHTIDEEQKASTWIIFALQMFVDMHRELGAEVPRAHRDLLDGNARMSGALRRYVDFAENHDGEWGRYLYTQLASSWHRLLETLERVDHVSDTFKMHNSWLGGGTLVDGPFYLENQPTYAGCTLERHKEGVHLFGVEAARHSEQLLFACHIYNAGLKNGLLRRWPDMEYLIAKQTETHLFLGTRPVGYEECDKRLLLMRGFSPSVLAKHKRAGRPMYELFETMDTKKNLGGRKLEIFSAFVRQASAFDGLKRVMLKTDENGKNKNEPIWLLERVVRHRLENKSKTSKHGKRRKQELSPLQTLETYRDAMKEDEFLLNFDIMTLDLIANKMIHVIKAWLRDFGDLKASSVPGSKVSLKCIRDIAMASAMLSSANKKREIWDVLDHIISRVGNMCYLRAEAHRGTVNLQPRNPAYEGQFLPTAAVFGGPNSPEVPEDWQNKWDIVAGKGAYDYHVSTTALLTSEQRARDKECNDFLEKLIPINYPDYSQEQICQLLGMECSQIVMPPKRAPKRKATDDVTVSRNANTAKRVAQENANFGTPREWPIEAKKGIKNALESSLLPDTGQPVSDESDSGDSELADFEVDGDGYDAAIKVEEEHEKRVERAHRHLAIRLHREEEVELGDVRGEWDLYSPNYLDLHEVDNRALIYTGHFNFHQWKTGKLIIGEHSSDTALSSMEATAKLSLTGLRNEWHLPLNLPKASSVELQPLQGIRQNYEGAGNPEVRLGISFLGNGYLKMRIPGIYIAGKREWRRHLTFYGINRTYPPQEVESPEPLPRPETPPPPEGFKYGKRGNLVRISKSRPKPALQPVPVETIDDPGDELVSSDEELRRRLLEELDDSLFVNWPDDN
ncbi:hypothetical protein J4E83_010889 [Alternaria metachromatica]|uniref:uncharacterized protein n=1 Tax=Alternaria metachromatica TaxID=283354 RepID=UPI0020C2EAD4|nr:uncharacterized protein J4E83_010889 [Alternaria metachromatica]KAI4605018.1 hypothetical protein J4E83_010889 [Alternaria metachromatica]